MVDRYRHQCVTKHTDGQGEVRRRRRRQTNRKLDIEFFFYSLFVCLFGRKVRAGNEPSSPSGLTVNIRRYLFSCCRFLDYPPERKKKYSRGIKKKHGSNREKKVMALFFFLF